MPASVLFCPAQSREYIPVIVETIEMNGAALLFHRTKYSRLGLLPLVLSGMSMLAGCGGGKKGTLPTIAFGPMAPPSSVMETSSVEVAATVKDDSANLGVSWLLTCSSPTATSCGSITRHTASGVPATFIAPLAAPPGGTVTIQANSSAVPSQSVTATIAITPVVYGPISVAFSPPPPVSVAVGTLTGIFVVVTNDHLDSTGKPLGSTLSLTCAAPGTCGFVSGSTYISPQTVPAGGTVTLTATSVADPTQSASATITITPPTVVISLVQLPPASIPAGAATNLGAMVTDGTSTNAAGQLGVDWSVTCGGTACGSVVPQHTANDVSNSSTAQKVTSYAAPSVVPPGGTVTVTATSTADPTKQASTQLTVTTASLNNSLLNGQYAFLLGGAEVDGTSALAGSIVADGNGNITAGEEGLAGISPLVQGIAGSYFIGTDGRGTMTLNGLPGFGFGGWLNSQQMFALTVVDSSHVFMEEVDGTGNYNTLNSTGTPWYGSTLRGTLELQHPSDFSVPPSGSYSFAFVHGGNPATQLPYGAYYGGVLTADAAGNIATFWMDRSVDGNIDSIVSGAYGPQSFGPLDSFGAGTVSLGPYTFNYFLVDSAHLIVVGSSSFDLTGLPAGNLYSQSPVVAPLAATYAFTLAGSTPKSSANGATVVGSSPQAMGGWFTSDSIGSVNGYLDTNNNGTVESATVSGTLTPSAVTGRWNLVLAGGGASQFAVYPTTGHGLLMFQLDTGKSGTGMALAQPQPPATFQGTYAASIQQSGMIDSTRNATTVGLPIGAWSDISGQIIANSSSTIAGSLDIDQLNGLYLAPSGNFWTQTRSVSPTGDFTPGTQGRLTGSLKIPPLGTNPLSNTMTIMLYVVDNSTVLVLEVDATPAVGVLHLQTF
jgi:hypothetical protein